MKVIYDFADMQNLSMQRVKGFPIFLPNPVQGSLQFAAQDGQRRPQLVGDIRDPLLAHMLIFLKGLCHRVKISRQLAQLILGLNVDSFGKLTGA